MSSLVSACQRLWMLPVQMCNTGCCRKELKRIRRAAFHTSLYHSCHAGEGWSHILLLLNSYLWSYVWPPNLPLLLSSLAPPPIPLGAEVIQKECRALVQQMIEGEKKTEERKESYTKIKDCGFLVLWCCEELSVLLFLKNSEVLLRTGCCAAVGVFLVHIREKWKTLMVVCSQNYLGCLLLSSKCQFKEVLKNKMPVISIHWKLKSDSLIFIQDFTAQMPFNVQSSHIWIKNDWSDFFQYRHKYLSVLNHVYQGLIKGLRTPLWVSDHSFMWN